MKVIKKIKSVFKREKATTKVEPKPASEGTEKKTTETSGEEGTKA